MQDEDFKRALEAIKLRAPIEDVVRERVPGLKKAGALWKACCPFHDERTPSFMVDPRKGTWNCYGACGTWGDQIDFLKRFDNLEFMDAVEILAARTGVELPKKKFTRDGETGSTDAALSVLEQAQRFYRAQLRTAEGQAAARYLRARGLSEATADAFGIGYAPERGTAFLDEVRAAGLDRAQCEALSLVRHNDEGRYYDFFRGRLMIPIRDLKGRTVGFGARRLSDGDEAGPKYVNSSETDVFKKGTLIYALDRALPTVRKSAHIVLVEGYTDVMAAHQCGVSNVVAVLGTATTDDHAALVRRSGARRVSLVFDGDEAGRKAAFKALHGLLPLELEIDVVSLAGGEDPCDLLVREGAPAFLAQVELAQNWFEFIVAGLRGASGVQLSREVDRVLELLARIGKPVHRDSRITELARELELPVAGVFAQFAALPSQRGGVRRPTQEVRSEAGASAPAAAVLKPDRDLVSAFEQLLVAELHDPALCAVVHTHLPHCPDSELSAIHAAIQAVLADLDARDEIRPITPGEVLTALGDSPARARLTRILPRREFESDDPLDVRAVFEGAERRLCDRLLAADEAELARRLAHCDRLTLADPEDPALHLELQKIKEMYAQIAERKSDLGNLSPVRPQARTVNNHG